MNLKNLTNNKPFISSIFLVLLNLSLVACNTNEPQAEASNDTAIAQRSENVTTEEVAEDTQDLIGQTVTIRSNALQVIEPSTFTVADQEFFGGENIVVVNATGEPFELPTEEERGKPIINN